MFKDKKSEKYLLDMKRRLSEDDAYTIKNSKGEKNNNTQNFTVTQPQLTLENVVLSKTTLLQLEEGMAKLRFHKTIYHDWNFSTVDKQGKTVILNFFGAPGTGKTLTAEAFAGSLNMPIIKLGIAELESKFMGETSKNIQAVFQAAGESQAILFFDEADTLLGKRLSSVTQGIDNEVNAMRSTLLIELEKFDGVVIFATNFAKNYDDAFRSRISHHIYFDLPDLENRKAIWNNMLVKEIPLAEERESLIDKAAELSEGFSGREIRTCMRLVLPKVLLEAEKLKVDAKVKFSHLQAVIEQVNLSKQEVANRSRASNIEEVNATKSLLGIK